MPTWALWEFLTFAEICAPSSPFPTPRPPKDHSRGNPVVVASYIRCTEHMSVYIYIRIMCRCIKIHDTCIYIRRNTNIHTYVYICRDVCICIYTYKYIYVYIYVYVDAYTHTYMDIVHSSGLYSWQEAINTDHPKTTAWVCRRPE